MSQVIITPVSKKLKRGIHANQPDSRRDYNEQCERLANGQVLCWDDTRANRAQVGDIFGFRHQDNCVEIHRIMEVHNPNHRLPSWGRNVGHENRNVLILSNLLCVIPWEDWVMFSWHASGPLMGTQYVSREEARQKIVQYVNEKIL